MATQTTVSGPSPFMEQYWNAAMPGLFQVANTPYQSYQGPRVAGMSDIQYQALAGIQNMMGNNPMLGQAQGLLSRLMGGSPNQSVMKPLGMPNAGMPVPKPGMSPQGQFDPWAMSRAAGGAGGGMGAPSVSGIPNSVGSAGMGGMGAPAVGNQMADQGDLSPGNPFMQQMIGDVTNQATRAYQQATGAINNRFTNPNSFGNSRHAMMQDQANEAFARGLGGALGQLQYGAYGEGLDRQMRAAQQAQGLQGQQFSQLLQGLQAGSIPQMLQQRQYDVGYDDFLNARRYPREQAEYLARILSGTPGSQSVTQTPDPSRSSQVLGSLLALAPFGFNFFGG